MGQVRIPEALIEVLEKQMVIIEQQANDLKCCGNCKKYTENRNCYNMRPGSYCHDWYPDGLARKDRK
jgi:hypothetical protein